MALTKITTSVIAANTLSTANIADNSIDATKIASNSILTRHIDDDQITGDQLADTISIVTDLNVGNDLTVTGNLTVNGSTVTNSASNTTIEDALIELGTGTSGSPSTDAGIVIERGSSDNVFIGWDESADKVTVGTGSFTGASSGNLTITPAAFVSGALTASGLAYPTSDGSANQVIQTDGSGNLSFGNKATSSQVDTYATSGDGSTTAFDTGTNPLDEKNTWVFIDGVYQQKSTYSYSGTTITFATAPDNGAAIDVITGLTDSLASSDTVLGVYEATTTATTTYTTGLSASNENNTWVFVGGVLQPKDSYTFSSGTLTFDAATPAGEKLSVTATRALTAGSVVTASMGANAVTSAKIASNSILSRHIANNSIVGADISATTGITASTFTGALTGNVTGNVAGNVTGNVTSTGANTFGSIAVDTNVLAVDATNDRVGIGTTSPSFPLDIHKSQAETYSATARPTAMARLYNTNAADGNHATLEFGTEPTSGNQGIGYIGASVTGGNSAKVFIGNRTGNTTYATNLTINPSGTVELNSDGVLSTGNRALRMNGYGTLGQTSSGQMTVLGHNVQTSLSTANTMSTINGSWYGHCIRMYYDEGISFHLTDTTVNADTTIFGPSTNPYERMRLLPNGTLVLGDPAGNTSKTGSLRLSGRGDSSSGEVHVGSIFAHHANADANVARIKFDGSSTAGNIQFQTAASGSLSEAMRITSGGDLSIGTTSNSSQLHVVANGEPICTFEGSQSTGVVINSYSGRAAIIGYDRGAGNYNDIEIRANSGTMLYLDGTSAGTLGIGTTSPNTANSLHVYRASGAYPYRHENGNGSFYMGHGNSSFHHFFQSGASTGFYFGSACQANGGFSTYSDERLKENITTIEGALDKVALMKGITFTWKDTEKREEGKQFGVTAQNMLEVDAELPKLVEDADATNEEIENDDIQTQYYSMDYARLTPYFIEAIKELKTQNEALKARIETLENN